jgi:hypothetical protein
MPARPIPLRRSIILASAAALLALLAAPAAEATQFVTYYGGPEVCVGFSAGPASISVHTHNPYGAGGPMPNTQDPLGPGDGWYALVSLGSGGC